MHQETPILRYALYHNIQQVGQQGNPSSDALKFYCNMSAGLANIDGTAYITCNLIYHMGFQIRH